MITFLMALAAAAPTPAPVEVMVVGMYHMNNPGRDVVNLEADDVTAPKRQREIEAVATALAGFRPTKVMVERQSKAPDLTLADYPAFTPADLTTKKDETYQIGYRIAQRLKLPAVYGIDEQPGPGEPDYFPFDRLTAYAGKHRLSATMGQLQTMMQGIMGEMAALQKSGTVADLLLYNNKPQPQHLYYHMLDIGDAEDQPGADLNAAYYQRNAKIFAKLMSQAKPGDRILVVYGAGHVYWLRHFAEQTPGYRFVDPVPYLQKAAKMR